MPNRPQWDNRTQPALSVTRCIQPQAPDNKRDSLCLAVFQGKIGIYEENESPPGEKIMVGLK